MSGDDTGRMPDPGTLVLGESDLAFQVERAEELRVVMLALARQGRRTLDIVTRHLDPALLDRLTEPNYPAAPQRAIVIEIEAWDTNCPQHIPQLLPAEDVAELVTGLRARVADLETRLRNAGVDPG